MTWADGFSGNVDIRVTANGCNGPSAQVTRSVTITPTVGTPTAITAAGEPTCQLINGTTTTTYSTTATNNTGYNWSLSNALAGVINPATGVMTWANGFSGNVDIRVTANGCNGPSAQVTRTVNITPTVAINTFTPVSSNRCQGAGIETYTTTATNSTGITYSLDAASLAGFNTINSLTGTVTYAAGWSGLTTITASATGCNGPVSTTHTVTITPSVTINAFSPASSTRCQGAGTVTYTTTGLNSTGISYTLDAGSITGGNTINSSNGELTYSAGWSGTTTITASAAGCNGPAIAAHVVTVNPSTGPTIFTSGAITLCQDATDEIYTATAVNSTSIIYSVLPGTAGSINPTSGLMNWSPIFSGIATITATSTGLCGTTIANRVVNVRPSTGATSFTAGPLEVCQDAPDETYTATALNSISIAYTVSPTGAGVINPATGVINWDAAFSGTATITATATGLCGTTSANRTVIVNSLPAISQNPISKTICEFGPVAFNVTASGANLVYKWEVDENTGTYITVPTGGVYEGESSNKLQIWSTVRSMNNYKFRVIVSGCSLSLTSGEALLTVNVAPEMTFHPSDTTVCLGNNAIMVADAVGTNLTWQWYVNKGSGFVPVTDANFSGTTNDTLVISNAQFSSNNWVFRAKATGTCGVPVFSNFAILRVINPPIPTKNPDPKVICEKGTTYLLGNGSGYMSLIWQVSTNSGVSWSNLSDTASYLGSGTQQLSIQDAPVYLNNNQYRLALIGECTTRYTNAATLTVNANPIVDFTSIDPVNACGGDAVVLNGNPTGGSGIWSQHRWTGDVGPLNNYAIQSPTFTSQISGTYSLNYRVTDNKGCFAEDNITINVDSPSARFTQDINGGCTPLSVSFIKDMTGITKFWWDFNDGSPIDSLNANPVHVFANTNPSSIGYYNVKLKVRSPGGCVDTFTSMITVYPSINATFTTSTNILCSGNPATFTTLPGASKYFWEYGDGASGYSTNVATHLYTNFTTAPVVLTVKLTTTSFYNCTDTKTLTITVMPVPLPQFTAVPPNQVYNAGGNPVTFTNTTNDGTWIWKWLFGEGTTSTVQNPVHTYTALGDFIVTLIASNANCSDSIKHTVSILPKAPVANFDSIPSGCEPLAISINNTSLNTETPGTTFRWDFGDGSFSTAKNPTYTYFDPGVYRVELTVTGPGGTSVKSQVVRAYASPRAYFEVSPNFVFVNDEKVRCFNLTEGGDSYLWEFGDGDTSKLKEPFHRYMTEGIYDITLWAFSSNGCSDKFILAPGVTVEPAGEVRFSTVFTPNKEGAIDRSDLPTGGTEVDQFFYPPIREKVTNYKLQIFNRLGVLIFESHNINIPWNGYYKGKLCPQGVYVWYVEGKYANGMPFKKVGDVTLLH
jgi:PKD repeat protein